MNNLIYLLLNLIIRIVSTDIIKPIKELYPNNKWNVLIKSPFKTGGIAISMATTQIIIVEYFNNLALYFLYK